MIKKYSIDELEILSKHKLIKHILDIYEIIDQVNSLKSMIETQEKKIEKLKQEGNKPKKNSKNSSKPSSTDLTKPHQKNYKKGKYGPKKGHKGASRKIVKEPDYVVKVSISVCPRTREKFSSNSNSYKRHQIIEITTPEVIVIEVQRQITTGPDGKTVIAPNPEGIKKYQRFGSNLKMQVAYKRFRENTPWEKILEWFKEIVGDKIAVGTLQSIFHELRESLEAEYEQIKEDVSKSDIVGADETGVHLHGEKWWFHVFNTNSETFFTYSKKRDHSVPQSVLGEDFSGVLSSDFWGAYNAKYFPKAAGFQKCIGAHAIRDLIYAMECEKGKGDYAKSLLDVVLDAIFLKKYFIFGTSAYKEECKVIEDRMDILLQDDVDTVTVEGNRLWKRFRRYRDSLLPFLYIEELSPDNNASERAVQELVGARKVSRAYQTEDGLADLTVSKSIIETSRKRGENFVEKFREAFGSFDFEYG